MNDICTYRVWLRGRVEEDEINAMSPLQMLVERSEFRATVLSACTDQSGLIGLIRHLHGLGLVILSIDREGEGTNGDGESHGSQGE